ncbi:hypothetical protein MIMGU_mgv1a015170mg [Erythranthe guttata]|uniref:Cystatin domain-containing protein n=1 Tax=Erythranthe guttata TaxID=4155 RepID=A0A022QER6_ERYGU|nr:PREDICTED: uncharacterized protein LOC105971691 [Erythranthe guttata]EYU24985.1 hypothetical protein MIMGU_mgv1a015170mg [Erythranthe guttata]|eukprot:XP_012852013.1 PREDICTED: uncharacterized protein LOC105971691 [Erythranthe guttata]
MNQPENLGESSRVNKNMNRNRNRKRKRRVRSGARARAVARARTGVRATVGGATLLYDPVYCTRCDLQTMRKIEEYTALCIDIYNKTHAVKYSVLKVLRATGHLFAGYQYRITFTAKPVKDDDDDDSNAKTFQATYAYIYKYVVSVDFAPPAETESDEPESDEPDLV